MCSRAVSSDETLDSGGFLDVGDPLKWTNAMSEAGIETSCVRIGQKLISVDRKVTTTMVTTFSDL